MDRKNWYALLMHALLAIRWDRQYPLLTDSTATASAGNAAATCLAQLGGLMGEW